MKKSIFILLFFLSCKKEVHYYPSKQFFEEKNPREIKLNDLSFGELVDSIANQIFERKSNFITIEDEFITNKICLFTYSGGLIKEKNALAIENDSIWWSVKKRPLKDLENYIEKHYGNNGKEYYLPYSYKRAFIKLTLDSICKKEIYQEKILYIINSFKKANFKYKDSCKLDILIDYEKNYKNQLFPPPPTLIEIENE